MKQSRPLSMHPQHDTSFVVLVLLAVVLLAVLAR